MNTVKHKTYGIGEVIGNETVTMGVAFVKADCHQTATQAFREQYAGQYHIIYYCEKLMRS